MKTKDELYVDAVKGIIIDITPQLFRNDAIDWEHVARMILKISETHLQQSKGFIKTVLPKLRNINHDLEQATETIEKLTTDDFLDRLEEICN